MLVEPELRGRVAFLDLSDKPEQRVALKLQGLDLRLARRELGFCDGSAVLEGGYPLVGVGIVVRTDSGVGAGIDISWIDGCRVSTTRSRDANPSLPVRTPSVDDSGRIPGDERARRDVRSHHGPAATYARPPTLTPGRMIEPIPRNAPAPMCTGSVLPWAGRSPPYSDRDSHGKCPR